MKIEDEREKSAVALSDFASQGKIQDAVSREEIRQVDQKNLWVRKIAFLGKKTT